MAVYGNQRVNQVACSGNYEGEGKAFIKIKFTKKTFSYVNYLIITIPTNNTLRC